MRLLYYLLLTCVLLCALWIISPYIRWIESISFRWDGLHESVIFARYYIII
jgi:hypothetical protein